MGEGLDYDVEVVVIFDVVHSYEAGGVFFPEECPGGFCFSV